MVCPPAGRWAGEDLAQVRGCCGSGTHKPHTQQRGQQQSSCPACQRLWRQRSSSPSLVCPSIFSKCKLPLEMWLVFSSHKGWSQGGTLVWVHFCSCQPGSLRAGTTHTGRAPWARGWLSLCSPPGHTAGERRCWAADKARKLLRVRHFRGGHDFHYNKHI